MDSPYPPPPPPDPHAGLSAAVPAATCYRHPDRPTRLACSSCGKPICVDCSHQASVGQKCPACAAPSGRNRVITAADVRSRTEGLGGAPVTRAILVVTVAIGILGFLVPAVWQPIASALVDDVRAVADGEVYRVVGAALLHSNGLPFHLLFNMYALYVFGPDLERRFGSVPFALFYTASAAAGGLAFQLLNQRGSALGASGAIFGLFGAYVISAYLARDTAAGRAGLNQLLPLLLLNLALPLLIGGIAWEAHVGGLVAGALMMYGWRVVEGRGAGADPGRAGGSGVVVRAGIAGGLLVACLAVLLIL